ncbi:TonB-dependent receptor [Alteraurantiacibacter aquimixticola]|uniref:TonB-dependent receptor n=1 Tax=Alteraurantiacibacter aquimixticola TaxID=2489173 RepID=A0A4T3F0B6_9SPHN|nr:TonB-dependent receptor [Alteraurantiacibacter aquimixticola]TIX50482.1 TonB-dependent receptor [Alteraurantiacibacter aquimixticola]
MSTLRRVSRPVVSALALATSLAMAAPALAQDEAGTDNSEEETNGNTIVVTGLRRANELQDTPVAITAFGAQAIEHARIIRPADFVNLTPNVNLVETQNAGNAFVIIRGITQARNSEPSVAVVVDGVLQVNPAQFNQQLFDIEQIEVMKGPQGALYGRNAIGGAIIVTTREPSDQLEGSVTAGIDNGFGYYMRGGVSGPLSDNAAFRLSGSWQDTDGYIDNEFLGEEADPVENLSLRGRLLFDLADNVELDLRASMDQLRTQALYFNIVEDVNDTSLPVRVNNAGQNDRDIYNVSAKLTVETDAFTVTSVTSYDTLEEILTGDAFDFLPIEESFFFRPPDSPFGFGLGLGIDLNQSQYLDVEAFSQEVRFESPADQDLFWMFGGYLIATDRYISTGNMVDLGEGVFPVYREPSTNPLNPQSTFLADSQDNFAWALFGNVGYQFSDAFRVDASLRYDHDKREQTTLTPTAFLPNIPGFPQGATGEVREISFDDWQPKVTLTFTPTSNVTLYGGYSRGFRSGGFNQTGVGAVAFDNGIVGVEDIYEAETADTFEIGTKLQLLDRMLSLNAAAYHTTSKNSYFFVFLAANSTQNLGNVGEVEIQGVELEALLRPSSDFQINAAWGLTFSDIKEFPDPSVIGNEAPLISRSTLNVGAQYNPALTEDLDALLRVDYRRTGRTWWDVPNSTVRDPIHLVNARIGVEGENWGLYGFATNLFDEEYNAEFSPGGFVFKARPRIYGVEASYRF